MLPETLDIEIKGFGADGTITGYASCFGGPADAVGDVVSPGAFRDSLAATKPAMLREHKGQPVGTWTSAEEDNIGLRVVGTVTDDATLTDLRSGRLDGLSIGFVATRSRKDAAGRRVLDAVSLPEISIVRRPASSRARVLSVKSFPAASAAIHNEDSTMTEETTAAPDNAATETETKTADITAAVSAAVKPLADRLGKLETAMKRPGTVPAEVKSSPSAEHAAFVDYLRFGTAGMQYTEVKALRLGDDTSGGYLATPDFLAEIDKNIVRFSPVRSLATVRNTSKSEVLVPKRTSAPTATWVDEIETRTEATIAYGQSRYPVKELAGYIDVSIALLEDAAVDIAAELAADIAEEMGRAEGEAFVTGSGVGRPLGFMSDTGIGSVNSGSASTITADGLIDLYHGVDAVYRNNGTFGMASATLATIRKLKTGDGQYLVAMAGLNNSPVTTILGRPVVEIVDMPAIAGSAYPVIFGDFQQGFRIFDRVGTSILRDELTQRTAGKVRFHFRKRVAAGVRKAEAMCKLKIST